MNLIITNNFLIVYCPEKIIIIICFAFIFLFAFMEKGQRILRGINSIFESIYILRKLIPKQIPSRCCCKEKELMKKKHTLLKIFLYLSLVVLGAIAGMSIGQYNKLSLSEEVNLMNVVTLLITIFLAVYIPAVLDRQLQTRRDRKDILENRITDYQSLLSRINILIQDENSRPFDTQLTVKNLLDITGHRLDTLISLIKNSGINNSLNKDIAEIKKMDNQHKELLKKIFENNSNSSETKQLPIYDNAIQKQEEILYNKFDEATSLLVFKISSEK